jgi:ferredoxin
VKDEDVCLHCGLCAERCPTGAWDMQKFFLEMASAGSPCASRMPRMVQVAGPGQGQKKKKAAS